MKTRSSGPRLLKMSSKGSQGAPKGMYEEKQTGDELRVHHSNLSEDQKRWGGGGGNGGAVHDVIEKVKIELSLSHARKSRRVWSREFDRNIKLVCGWVLEWCSLVLAQSASSRS